MGSAVGVTKGLIENRDNKGTNDVEIDNNLQAVSNLSLNKLNSDYIIPTVVKVPTYSKYPYIDFKVLSRLNEGKFVKVFKAESWSDSNLKVALKEINIRDMNRDQVANFVYELSVLSQIYHKNILRITGIYEPPSVNKKIMFVTAEFLRGGEILPNICKQTKYSEKDVKIIIKQLASAIQYLHKRGVIHGNIIPESIVLSRPWFYSTIKLVNFSYAECDLHRKYAAPTEAIDIDFRAPELDELAKLSLSMDIWSLGVIAHVLLSGELPYTDTIFNMGEQENSFTSKQWELVGASAKEFICSILKVSPTQRFNAEQVLAHPWIRDVHIEEQYIDIVPRDMLQTDYLLTYNLPQLREFQSRREGILNANNGHWVSGGWIRFLRSGRYSGDENYIAQLN